MQLFFENLFNLFIYVDCLERRAVLTFEIKTQYGIGFLNRKREVKLQNKHLLLEIVRKTLT